MRLVRLILLVYLFSALSFGFGMYVQRAKIWPYSVVREVFLFLGGHPDEESSLAQKIRNDLDIKPERFIHSYSPLDLANFTQVTGLPLTKARETPIVRLNPTVQDGYIYIAGKFDFTGGMNGVLLLTTGGQLVNYWIIPDDENRDGHWHSLFVSPNGEIVHGPDNEKIKKIDYCGKVIWESSSRSRFHHSIARNSEGLFWVSGSALDQINAVSLVDFSNGLQKKEVLLRDIHATNSGQLSIFDLIHRYLSLEPEEAPDLWHHNDVEPLLDEMASAFPTLNAGDLAISYRHLNLVYIFDPETLKIKWWAQSRTSAQHDIDWQPNGTVTVFDNRHDREGDYSTIVRFRPPDDIPEVVFDGRDQNFFSGHAGKHEYLDDGSLLLLSSPQGRVLMLDSKGEVLFEFINRYADGKILILMNAGYLPASYFTEEVINSC